MSKNHTPSGFAKATDAVLAFGYCTPHECTLIRISGSKHLSQFGRNAILVFGLSGITGTPLSIKGFAVAFKETHLGVHTDLPTISIFLANGPFFRFRRLELYFIPDLAESH